MSNQQQPRPRSNGVGLWWKVLGAAVAVVIVVGGLAVLASAVVLYVALGDYGSNK